MTTLLWSGTARATPTLDEALVARDRAEWAGDDEALRQALDDARRALGPAPRGVRPARVLASLCEERAYAGDPGLAACLDEAKAAAGGDAPPSLIARLEEVGGLVARATGDTASAERLWEACIEHATESGATLELANCEAHLAQTALERGDRSGRARLESAWRRFGDLDPPTPSRGFAALLLGRDNRSRGEHEDALAWFLTALDDWEDVVAPSHPIANEVRQRAGLYASLLGDQALGVELAEEAWHRAPQPGVRTAAAVTVADALLRSGDPSAALAWYARAEDSLVAVPAAGQPRLRSVIAGNRAAAHMELGELSAAARFSELALAASDDPENPIQRMNLALTAFELGDEAGAFRMLEHALKEAERREAIAGLPPGASAVEMISINLAHVAFALGDASRSEALARRALASSTDPNGTLSATSILVSALVAGGRIDQARELGKATLASLPRPLTPGTADVAHDLVVALRASDDDADTARLALEALVDARAAFTAQAPHHPRAAWFAVAEARALIALGRPEQALATLSPAIPVLRRAYGDFSTYTSLAFVAMAQAAHLADQPDVAAKSAADAARTLSNVGERAMSRVSAHQRERLARAWGVAVSRVLSVPMPPGAAWDMALAWKHSARRASVHAIEPEASWAEGTTALLEERETILAAIVAAQVRELIGGAVRHSTVRDLHRALETVDVRLADAGVHAMVSPHGWEDACVGLEPGEAVVDYVAFQRTLEGGQRLGAPHLVAFVARAEHCDAPSRVDLGPLAPIDAAVAELERARSEHAADFHAAFDHAGVVADKIWRPVAAAVGAAERVWISPAGSLTRVSFAGLPLGAERFLVDDHGVALVEDVRDLARPDPGSNPNGGVLLVGDVRYETSRWRRALDAMSDAVRRSADCVGELAPLGDDGFLEEARRGWSTAGRKVTVLRGRGAGLAAVRAAAEGSSVVHLSTHGILFAGRPCALVTESRDAVGVALSNARTDPTDGVLLPAQLRTWDLAGVEVLVLSACHTGRGPYALGEGVLGLARAAAEAGAANVVVGLWYLVDAPTSDIESTLHAQLAHGASSADALATAQRAFLAERREQGRPTWPELWAPLVVVRQR